MTERKLNKNALRSKAMIRDAFITLLERKSMDSITVTDIVKQADINRATFYAHYSCIADLGEEIEKEIVDKLLEILSTFSLDDFSANPAKLLMEISKFIDANMSQYRILLEKTESYSYRFIQKLMEIIIKYLRSDSSIPDEIKNNSSFELTVYYIAGGISSLYMAWLKGSVDASIYDIPIEVATILTNPGFFRLKNAKSLSK